MKSKLHKMGTPICDFVGAYSRRESVRLHMPGHKGNRFLGFEELDITEIDGADVLYNAHGIIEESQKNASELFGTARTLYSTEGSSLCIRAMVYMLTLLSKKQGKSPRILAGRNAHKAFMYAAALSDVDVEWLYPESDDGLVCCVISPERLDKRLSEMAELPVAVYITSPDYLGNVADVKGLSQVCRKHGVCLVVDNAHGAYLKFIENDVHPISLGADICCDSAHKTLPVLTGGAYLHISHRADRMLFDVADSAMSLFASTSPSYLILQSLDAANAYMSDGYGQRLAELSERVSALRARLSAGGYCLASDEPLKLTIKAKRYGYRGYELADLLSERGFVCEFYDEDAIVMMFTPEIGEAEINALGGVLLSIPKRAAIDAVPPPMPTPERAMTVREAMFSPSVELEVEKCEGRVLAAASVSCPPAIPIAVCGEIIARKVINSLLYYGITRCRVCCAE